MGRGGGAARAAVTAVFCVHGAVYGTWVARIPALKEGVGADKASLGLALFCGAIGALAAMAPAGALAGRVGSRWLAVGTGLAFCATLALLPHASSVAALSGVLFLLGAAAGSMDVSMNAHAVAVERALRRPVMSSVHAAFSVGGLAGAGVAALAARGGMGLGAHFGAVAAALALVLVLSSARLLPASADSAAEGPAFVRPPRRLLALAAVVFCSFLAEGAAGDWSAVLIDESLGASAAVAALGFAAFSVTMIAGRLLGDRATSAWGAVRVVRAGGALGAVGLSLAVAGGRPWLAVAGFALVGAGLAAIVPVAYRAAGTTPGIPAGTGIAAVTTLGYTGFLLGPPLIGVLAEATSLRAALGAVVAVQAALVVLVPAARAAQGAAPVTTAAPERLP